MSLKKIRDAGIIWRKETGRKPFLNYCVDGTNNTEKDFEFTYVLIEDIVEEKNDKSAYEEYDYVLSQVAPDAKVTAKKLLKVNCTYTEPGGHGSYSLMLHRGNKYVDVAVYTIDGEPYVIS